jgi:CTP synthase (UTP-ammonia lyase)
LEGACRVFPSEEVARAEHPVYRSGVAGSRGCSLAVALVGDHDPQVTAHRAIPLALERAARELGVDLRWDWLHTARLGRAPAAALEGHAALWCVPASPYADTEAALAAIRFARERRRPFLGTCGGFQHALLEYARNALGVPEAAHAETDPSAADPLIAPLACPLVEREGPLTLAPGSRLAAAYASTEIVEGYHCRYGPAARLSALLEGGPLRITGRDAAGEPRAVELDDHPFFVATLFQPERAALRDRTPPLVRAFVAAAADRSRA